MRILSIDAWGNKKEGYDWNNCFTVGEISKSEFELLKTDKDFTNWMRNNGFQSCGDLRQIRIEDDQYNIVFVWRKTDRPLYAIEYGPEY